MRAALSLPLLVALLPWAVAARQQGRTVEQVYKRTPQGELIVHLHFPRDWKKDDRRSAIVFFFGGGWRQGSPGQFLRQAEYLASRGMVSARADYRVQSRHGTTPDRCVEDARSAVRWLRRQATMLGIDPDRIVAGGGSAGAHIAACAALLDTHDAPGEDRSVSARPNALVLFNPPMDLRGLNRTDAEGRDLGPTLSPVLFVRKNAPPAIQFFGTADRLLATGEAYHKRAKELGARSELYTAAGQPHGFFNRAPWQEITLREVDRFLGSLGHLTGGPTISAPAGATEALQRVE